MCLDLLTIVKFKYEMVFLLYFHTNENQRNAPIREKKLAEKRLGRKVEKKDVEMTISYAQQDISPFASFEEVLQMASIKLMKEK